jgi:hypothetical protein
MEGGEDMSRRSFRCALAALAVAALLAMMIGGGG